MLLRSECSKQKHSRQILGKVARNAAEDNNAQRFLHWFVLCFTEMHLPHRWTPDLFLCEETKRLESDSLCRRTQTADVNAFSNAHHETVV